MVLYPLSILSMALITTQFTSADIDMLSKQARSTRNDCGPVALYYCLRRLGSDITLDKVKSQALLDEQGMSLSNILKLAKACDPSLNPQAIKISPSQLNELVTPSILVLKGHCVVYDGLDFQDGKILLFDPARMRSVEVSEAELGIAWSGEVIVLEMQTIPSWVSVVTIVFTASLILVTGGACLLFQEQRGAKSVQT